jgi:hypothetical protein
MRDEWGPDEHGTRGLALRERAGEGASAAMGALLDAVRSLYESALDRVLATDERVTSAAEGKALLASGESTEALADGIQRVVALATPVVRTLAHGARFSRVPWALVASTTVTSGIAVRTGVREVQVLGSLVAHRLEQATGRPPDAGLLKKLTIELYLKPSRPPDLSSRRLPVVRLMRRWVLSGALGRDTGKTARKALDAAERLDAAALASRWPPPRT